MQKLENITLEIIKKHLEEGQIEFFPTQHTLCIPIINRIYQKMMNNLRFDEIQVCQDLIMDGHHRYISSLLAQKGIQKVPTHRTSATKKYDWGIVEFVDVEWDTQDKIEKLNRDDAEFNRVPLAQIVGLVG